MSTKIIFIIYQKIRNNQALPSCSEYTPQYMMRSSIITILSTISSLALPHAASALSKAEERDLMSFVSHHLSSSYGYICSPMHISADSLHSFSYCTRLTRRLCSRNAWVFTRTNASTLSTNIWRRIPNSSKIAILSIMKSAKSAKTPTPATTSSAFAPTWPRPASSESWGTEWSGTPGNGASPTGTATQLDHGIVTSVPR